MISLTEDIRKNLDKGNIGCGIFVNLQKAFDTAGHDILLAKLKHGICGIANEWLKSTSLKEKILSLLMVSIKGSVLEPLLFLIYINDLNHAIKFCKVHHFADDTNLVYFNKSVYKLNKHINIDMKNLFNWLNAHKMSLNV